MILSVELLLPDVVTETGFGVKDALVLDGKPEMLRLTEPLPPTPVSVTVTLPLEPRFTVSDDPDREIVKSAGTFSVTVAVCVVPSDPVPVIVSV